MLQYIFSGWWWIRGDEIDVEVVYDSETILPLDINCDASVFLKVFVDSIVPENSFYDEILLGEVYCTYTFSEYNKVSVLIPESVKDRG